MKDDKIVRLLKTISEPKSEKELLSLCERILKEETVEEKPKSESENGAYKLREERSKSKKQAVL